MDAEELCRSQRKVVFAAFEEPFSVTAAVGPYVNWFCNLLPLMTIDGEILTDDPLVFPNRGRVWWMLKDSIQRELVLPGTIWSGPIEEAAKYDPTKHESDQFQAVVNQIQPGGPELVEILSVNEADPDLDRVVRTPKPLPWPRPTTSFVVLMGRRSVLGPLRANWDQRAGGLILTPPPISPTIPGVLRVPLEAFLTLARIQVFDRDVHDAFGGIDATRSVRLHLSKISWLNLDRLREKGTLVDTSSDRQILNWSTGLQKYPRQQVAPLRDLLQALSDQTEIGSVQDHARKLDRLREITADAERIAQLGEEVARELASTPAFEDLIRSHADTLVNNRVEAEIQKRRYEIQLKVAEDEARFQRQLTEHDGQLKSIQSKLAMLQSEYQAKLQSEERKLQESLAARVATLEKNEAALSERERRLNDQERAMSDRLKEVTRRYQEEGERIGNEVLLQLPMLKTMLGLGAAPQNAANGWEPAAPTSAAIVGYPTTPVETARAGNRTAGPTSASPTRAFRRPPKTDVVESTESEFVERFVSFVREQGFVFDRHDLINFHVSVKTGGLTILAGRSGTGKSSLPRLYAQALGVAGEYLHVPVRPDWLDDRDLVGAFNVLARRFEPANSGLVEHLISAEFDQREGRGGMFLVCLDEMNLARVEHYFAQFLSVLELPTNERRISLFAEGMASPNDPFAEHRSLLLGANLRFLGTVNIDETTHFFSPKVLDRSQVVVFATPNLKDLPQGAARPPARTFPTVSRDVYASWIKRSITSSARNIFIALNDILNKSRLGMGFRQFERALTYIDSAKPLLKEDDAIDYQIYQVILPRLRPTAPRFHEMLKELRSAVPLSRFRRSAEHLSRISEDRSEDDFFQLL